jgi:hypothetical protein
LFNLPLLYQNDKAMNKHKVTVTFNNYMNTRITSTPTFQKLFGRIPEVANNTALPNHEYTFMANNTLMGDIKRMGTNFRCIQSVTFSKI